MSQKILKQPIDLVQILPIVVLYMSLKNTKRKKRPSINCQDTMKTSLFKTNSTNFDTHLGQIRC